MIKTEIFKQLIVDFISRPLPSIKRRSYTIPTDLQKVIIIHGHKGSGKTFLLYSVINTLRAQLQTDRLIYINFDDDRLFPHVNEDLDKMINAYYQLYPENMNVTVYFFLDEVHLVPNWQKLIREIYDQENCRIYIAGPYVDMIPWEAYALLSGKILSIEVMPLDFSEFLYFNGIEIEASTQAQVGRKSDQAVALNALQRFLIQGGFPELNFIQHEFQRQKIHECISLVLYRDLGERYDLRNISSVRYLLKFILSNSEDPISVHKIYTSLKSTNLGVSKQSTYDYFFYLQQAFSIFVISKWDISSKIEQRNPVKVYPVDVAYNHSFASTMNFAKQLENIVYLQLRRQSKSIYYFHGKETVDFVLDSKRLIDVKYNLENTTAGCRELRGLQEAMKHFRMRDGLLLTWCDERKIKIVDGGWIHVVPIWKFLLRPGDYRFA